MVVYLQISNNTVQFHEHPDCSLLTDGAYHMGFTRNNSDIDVVTRLFPDKETIQLNQIHGSIILDACLESRDCDGDGLLAQADPIIPVIRTADCVPLFFWHRRIPFYGILHIGWRGFVAKIQRRLFKLTQEHDINPRELNVLLGPAICPQHYPVGFELISEFEGICPLEEICSAAADERFHLDLKQAIRIDLMALGLPGGQIMDCGICTYESLDLPSYRREKNGARIYNFITRG